MKRLIAVAVSTLALSGCALFQNSQSDYAAPAAPALDRPTVTPVALGAPKVAHNPKSASRAAPGPRAIVPCFGDSPLANPCRWDGALDRGNALEDIRSQARKDASSIFAISDSDAER